MDNETTEHVIEVDVEQSFDALSHQDWQHPDHYDHHDHPDWAGQWR